MSTFNLHIDKTTITNISFTDVIRHISQYSAQFGDTSYHIVDNQTGEYIDGNTIVNINNQPYTFEAIFDLLLYRNHISQIDIYGNTVYKNAKAS